MTVKDVTDVVEACPYCGCENVFTGWDVKSNGFVADCWQCGKEILLCDECMHADDNQAMKCDWHGTYVNENGNWIEKCGRCFRGETRNIERRIQR